MFAVSNSMQNSRWFSVATFLALMTGFLVVVGCNEKAQVASASKNSPLSELDSHDNFRQVPQAPPESDANPQSGKQDDQKQNETGDAVSPPVTQSESSRTELPSADTRQSSDAPTGCDQASEHENDVDKPEPDQSDTDQSDTDGFDPQTEQFEVADEQTIEIPETWKRLGRNEIWVDFKNKQVILGGYVCINVGALEMFACPAGTKEHEAIVAANARADEMHSALIAVGAKPGAPCSWDDVSFTSASGSRIGIDVRWRDEKTGQVLTRPAKEMMKMDEKPVSNVEFIFGGSKFQKYPDSETGYYVANSGEMICVSNFSTAAIDISIDSSDTNSSLLFWANTDKVPPRGTRVYLILTPGEYFQAQRQVFEESKDKANSPGALEPSRANDSKLGDLKSAEAPEKDDSQQPQANQDDSSQGGSKNGDSKQDDVKR